jgi:predicted O-methyltransferase YrrM
MNTLSVPATAAPGYSRPLRHLTPRYVYNRTRQMLYERGHTDDPWLTPTAIALLDSLLRREDTGVEFGSGRSTIWFAARVSSLTSVEHDEQWYQAVAARLAERGVGNVDYILAPEDQPQERGADSRYARAALAFADGTLDFALVDGNYREHTAKLILPKVRPGGMLIVDNANLYLPCRSKSPNSRTAELGPKTQVWAAVWAELAGWRSIWTSSGVWDTAIFVKPAVALGDGPADVGRGTR